MTDFSFLSDPNRGPMGISNMLSEQLARANQMAMAQQQMKMAQQQLPYQILKMKYGEFAPYMNIINEYAPEQKEQIFKQMFGTGSQNNGMDLSNLPAASPSQSNEGSYSTIPESTRNYLQQQQQSKQPKTNSFGFQIGPEGNFLPTFQNMMLAKFMQPAAEVSSKMTYSQLMQPQYLSKLLSNPEAMAALPPEVQNSIMQHIQQSIPSQTNRSNMPIQMQSTNGSQGQMPGGVQGQDELSIQQNQQPEQTFQEKVGEFKGVEAEKEALGKQRAADYQKLSDVVEATGSQKFTISQMSNILNASPWREMRKIEGIAGPLELGYYAKFGTPEQKKMVGNYLADSGQLIVNAASLFKGQFRRGEQNLLNSMKAGPNDTTDAAKGKLQGLLAWTDFMRQRALIAGKLMIGPFHLNKSEALDYADSALSGDKIRENADKLINPPKMISIRNKKTGQLMRIPEKEAKSKYGIE